MMRAILRTLQLLRSPSVIGTLFGGIGAQGVLLSGFVLVLVTLLLVPLPTVALDLLLVTNFVISLILIFMALFVSDWRQLYAFPSILLLTTLFRLALNVSSTRLILLHGDSGHSAAGQVIAAFGSLVVQGDFVVGSIVFAIIAIVNFVVITKGAGRVAEVAARFTLDALPGRQFAVDADLRAGNITREEATRARQSLTQESQFFGAMDGAMKFVQGDAIAGFVIVFINAIGGVAIGVSRGLDFGTAINSFGVLTIGDGMVNIVPAILISVCSGLVVTRVANRDQPTSNTSRDILRQMSSDPRILVMTAGILVLLSVVPGLPFAPFFTVALVLLAVAGMLLRREPLGAASDQTVRVWLDGHAPTPLLDGARSGEHEGDVVVALDPIVLGRVFDSPESVAAFQSAAHEYRAQFLRERGVAFPQPVVRLDTSLEPGQFQLSVRGQILSGGTLNPRAVFVGTAPANCRVFGFDAVTDAKHPLLGTAASWVETNGVDPIALARTGATVCGVAEYLALVAFSGMTSIVDEFVGVEEVSREMDQFRDRHRGLADEVLGGNVLSLSELAEILRRLVRDRVSIGDLKLILEGIAEFAATEGPFESRGVFIDGAHLFVRRVLSRMVLTASTGPSGSIRAFTLAPEVEDRVRDALGERASARTGLALDPEFQTALRQASQSMFSPVLDRGAVPVVIVCSDDIRLAVDGLFGRHFQTREWYRTLSYDELDGRIPFENVGILRCNVSDGISGVV